MSIILTILGSSSAMPKSDRNTTAHVLNVHERFFLIDCGEGTQLQLRRNKIRLAKLHHIFISHLHGDHFFGLPGLLSSFNLMGRKVPLNLYGPPKLETYLNDLFHLLRDPINYPIEFHPSDYSEVKKIYVDKHISVESVPLKHKVPTVGYIFREQEKERKLKKSVLDRFNLSVKQIIELKAGHDIRLDNGQLVESLNNTEPGNEPASFAFISDTKKHEGLVPILKGVDVLYHEATYHSSLQDRAKKTGHSSSVDAAEIALAAEVKKLIIGHFSARYKDITPLLEEARSIFKNTIAAEDNLVIPVNK